MFVCFLVSQNEPVFIDDFTAVLGSNQFDVVALTWLWFKPSAAVVPRVIHMDSVSVSPKIAYFALMP